MHIRKSLILLTLAAACAAAQAQPSPAKKQLIDRILKMQQPGVERLARALTEEPAREIMMRAGPVLASRVAPDKRDAVAKEVEADARKFVDDAGPLVKDRALKLAPTTVGTLLDEKFTEDELKQVVAMMESPVYLKFQGMGGEMERVLTDKLVQETRPLVEPKVRVMEESIAKRLGVTAQAPAEKPAAAEKPKAQAPAKKQ
jgi:hypothetical protein